MLQALERRRQDEREAISLRIEAQTKKDSDRVEARRRAMEMAATQRTALAEALVTQLAQQGADADQEVSRRHTEQMQAQDSNINSWREEVQAKLAAQFAMEAAAEEARLEAAEQEASRALEELLQHKAKELACQNAAASKIQTRARAQPRDPRKSAPPRAHVKRPSGQVQSSPIGNAFIDTQVEQGGSYASAARAAVEQRRRSQSPPKA